jgi:hypothetical protein
MNSNNRLERAEKRRAPISVSLTLWAALSRSLSRDVGTKYMKTAYQCLLVSVSLFTAIAVADPLPLHTIWTTT